MKLENLPKIRVSIKERTFLNQIPQEPGIYQMLNQQNKIIYIGKAKNLKKRIASYFVNTSKDIKTSILVKQIDYIDCIVTLNELEAFILESNLIKKEQPKYNIRLKDNKQYPMLKVTLEEPYPRLLKTRQFDHDQSRYFGPYSSSKQVNEILKLISKWFRLRSCSFTLPSKQEILPCLDYYIQRCDGCCINIISPESYRKQYIQPVLLLLSGKYSELSSQLTDQMKQASSNLNFMKAAELKKQIEAIEYISSKQYVYSNEKTDIDIFSLRHHESRKAWYLSVFSVKNGILLGKRSFLIKDDTISYSSSNEDQMLTECIQNYYHEQVNDIPEKIVTPIQLKEFRLLENLLSKKKLKRVRICTANSKENKGLLRFANKNLDLVKYSTKETGLKELQSVLELKEIPKYIEGFDIANILGQQSVAAMVCFKDGKANKSEYRHYKIQSVKGPNDFASIQEAVARRYQYCVNESIKLPDLILIDGGKGQVKYAQQALDTLNLSIPIIGLAKKKEIIVRPNQSKEIKLAKESKALQLIQRVRDEAHRFSNQFHRRWRNKVSIESRLDGIKGIGAKRKLVLLTHFKTIKAIQHANIEELQQLDLFSKKIAETVYHYFCSSEPNQ